MLALPLELPGAPEDELLEELLPTVPEVEPDELLPTVPEVELLEELLPAVPEELLEELLPTVPEVEPLDEPSSLPPHAARLSASKHVLAIVTGRCQPTSVLIKDIFTYLF